MEKIGLVGDKIYLDGKHIANVVSDAQLNLFLIHYNGKQFRSADREKVLKKLENYISKNTLNESLDMTKPELEELIKDIFRNEFKKEQKDLMSQDEVKKIVKKMIKKQYKTFYDKSNFFIDNL